MWNLPRRTAALFTIALMAVMLMLTANDAHAGDGKAALAYVPQDSMMVLSVNVDRLKSSPLYQTAMKKILSEPDVQNMIGKLKTDAGFDIEKDISTLVVSIPPDVEKSENFLIIAEGNFDKGKIVNAMKKEGAKITDAKHGAVSYHEIDGQGAVLFDGKTVIVGSKDMVKQAIDSKADGSKSVKSNATMSKLLGSVDASKDLWVTFNIPESLKKQMGGNPMVNDLKTVTASLDVNNGLGVDIDLDTASAATATNIATMMQAQVKAFANAAEMKQMGFDVALNKLTAAANGTTVAIDLKLTSAEFQGVQKAIENVIKSGL